MFRTDPCTMDRAGFLRDWLLSDKSQGVRVTESPARSVLIGFIFFAFGFLALFRGRWQVLDAVTAPADGDGLGVVQEAIQDRPGGGHIVQEFAPFFQGT